jgi:hypothetical protein
MKVFVSYTRTRNRFGFVSEFVAHLENELQMRNSKATVFFDTNDIIPGDLFSQKLVAELKATDVFMPLISPSWFESEWCKKEFWTFYKEKQLIGKTPQIIPVLWVTTTQQPKTEIDAMLGQYQFIDMRELRKQNWGNNLLKNTMSDAADAAMERVPEKDREEQASKPPMV